MQKKSNSNFSSLRQEENLYDLEDFIELMTPKKLKSTNLCSPITDPRKLYLYTKALMGDKDEIPKITTQAVAARIARHVCGVSSGMLCDSDKQVLNNSQDQLAVNLKLAETNWLLEDEKVKNNFDMSKVLLQAHEKVEKTKIVDNFLEFAVQNGCLTYQEKWNRISKLLNKNLPIINN